MAVLNSSFYKKIEAIIGRILVENGCQGPPVQVDKVAVNCGTQILKYEMGNDVSGMLVISSDKGVIGINPSQSRVRQRFTIAHELGHYLLHKDAQRSQKEQLFVDKDFIVKFRSQKSYSSAEWKHESEANAFAAALLMPRDFVLREMTRPQYENLSETELIEELARTFDVSVPAMSYRLSDLNLREA